MPSVYLIRNILNSKCYVGVTCKAIEERFREHIWAAKRGEPWRLQRAIRKYGPENFKIELLVGGLSAQAAQLREIAEIAVQGTLAPSGYNLSLGGEKVAGVHKTERFRQAVSAALKGRKKTPQHVARVAKALLGKKHTPEARAKVAAARAKQVFSADTVERRTAKLRGRKHTAQAVANMSAGQKGKQFSATTRVKIARTLSRLSDEQVRMVRLNAERLTGKAWADCFGVSQQMICDIRKGRTYKHVAV